MKKTILMIVFVIGVIGTIQSQLNNNPNNFTVVKGKVQWKKIYETDLTVDELESSLKNSPITSKLERKDNVFTGMIKSLGVIDGKYKGVETFTKIEVKENRYRVLIKGITLDPVSVSISGHSMNSDTRVLLSDLVVNKKKGVLKKNRKTALDAYNKYFTDIFKLVKIQSDNW